MSQFSSNPTHKRFAREWHMGKSFLQDHTEKAQKIFIPAQLYGKTLLDIWEGVRPDEQTYVLMIFDDGSVFELSGQSPHTIESKPCNPRGQSVKATRIMSESQQNKTWCHMEFDRCQLAITWNNGVNNIAWLHPVSERLSHHHKMKLKLKLFHTFGTAP